MTRNKANPCNHCCCSNCENKLPKELRCCCHCICDALCVTILMGEAGSGTACSCEEISVEFPYDCVTNSWHGTVVCGDLSVDLEFSVKQCNDICYICLESDCLGMPYGDCPDDCIEFNVASETGTGTGTGTLSSEFCRGSYGTGSADIVRIGGLEGTWENIDFSGCGDSNCDTLGTISVACVERIFPSCKKDCKDPICGNCDCTCRCVCISFVDFDAGTGCKGGTEKVCWDKSIGDKGGWTASFVCPDETVDITVEIVENGTTGDCELKLTTNIGAGNDDNIDLTCPDFSVEWLIENGSADTIASVSISCNNCGDCGGIVVCESCPDDLIPRILTLTIEAARVPVSGCDNLVGLQFQLVNPSFQIDFSCWEGVTQTVDGCDIELSLDCLGVPAPTNNFELCLDGLKCVCGVSQPATVISCNPFEVLFLDVAGSVGACCSPGPTTVNIRVTE